MRPARFERAYYPSAGQKRVGGKTDPAFAHASDPTQPLRASPAEQLYRAWLVWKSDAFV
jgi:hypothetical protein